MGSRLRWLAWFGTKKNLVKMKSDIGANPKNLVLIFLFSSSLNLISAQQQDNFKCPDQFEGFYPHLYSCDRYWKCTDRVATLETCGNGLAFDDTDPTFAKEECDLIHNVKCGSRTEFEPPISATNCPRLNGDFEDPENCAGWYNCRAGISTRYTCAPGLGWDKRDRICKWADQVTACQNQKNDENPIFLCPKAKDRRNGVYSKHAHPQDCRQYFVCIAGEAREYGCPLGSVFKITSSGQDGVCANPADVPECANYYGDLEFGNEELVKAGVDPEVLGIDRQKSQSGQRVSSNSFSSFDEPILVPAIIPARPKPIEKINTNRAQPPQ